MRRCSMLAADEVNAIKRWRISDVLTVCEPARRYQIAGRISSRYRWLAAPATYIAFTFIVACVVYPPARIASRASAKPFSLSWRGVADYWPSNSEEDASSYQAVRNDPSRLKASRRRPSIHRDFLMLALPSLSPQRSSQSIMPSASSVSRRPPMSSSPRERHP